MQSFRLFICFLYFFFWVINGSVALSVWPDRNPSEVFTKWHKWLFLQSWRDSESTRNGCEVVEVTFSLEEDKGRDSSCLYAALPSRQAYTYTCPERERDQAGPCLSLSDSGWISLLAPTTGLAGSAKGQSAPVCPGGRSQMMLPESTGVHRDCDARETF